MEQIAEEGIDFQLFGVTTVTKQIIYLSRLSTCDSRRCSTKTALEDETVSVLSANGASLLWFFLHGHFGSSFAF